MDGKSRLLLWRNRGVMGCYQDAMTYKNLNNQIPDFETYYNWRFKEGVQFTLDYQRVENPSCNAYRGLINIYGARLHLEY